MQNQKYTFYKDGYMSNANAEKVKLMNRKERRDCIRANGGFKRHKAAKGGAK